MTHGCFRGMAESRVGRIIPLLQFGRDANVLAILQLRSNTRRVLTVDIGLYRCFHSSDRLVAVPKLTGDAVVMPKVSTFHQSA